MVGVAVLVLAILGGIGAVIMDNKALADAKLSAQAALKKAEQAVEDGELKQALASVKSAKQWVASRSDLASAQIKDWKKTLDKVASFEARLKKIENWESGAKGHAANALENLQRERALLEGDAKGNRVYLEKIDAARP